MNSGPTSGADVAGSLLGGGIGVKVFRYRALLNRYWWLVLACMALGLIIQIWRTWQQPVLFDSNATLMMRTKINLTSNKTSGFTESTDQNIIINQIALMRSDDMQGRAYARINENRPELQGGYVKLDISSPPQSTIINITGTGANPEFTQEYLNSFVEEVIQSIKDERLGNRSQRAKELKEQLKRTIDDVTTTLSAYTQYTNENNLSAYEASLTSLTATLDAYKKKKAELETELSLLNRQTLGESFLNSNRPASGSGQISSENASSSESNRYLESLLEVQNLQALHERAAEVLRPKHPRMVDLTARLRAAEKQIALLEGIFARNKDTKMKAVKDELEVMESKVTEAQKAVDEHEKKGVTWKQLKTAWEDKVASQKETENTITALENAGSETEVDLSIFTKPTRAVIKKKNWAGAIILGLVAGFAIASLILYLKDRFDDRVASSSELMDHFTESLLGQIPNVETSRTEAGLPLLRPDDDRYTYGEAYRSLRSSLIFLPDQQELKTLLITSAIPNEGKSTTACNLAITMSLAGTKVLLVDADLRRGDVAALFDVDGRKGLSDVLRGEVNWRDAVRTTAHYPHLHIIPRGPVTNQSGELLLRPEFDQIMDQFKKEFDLIIFNSAPILATDDTPTIAARFDGVLMIIRAQFTAARMTRNALNALYQRQANIIGLILNSVNEEVPDYYYYRYPKYYAA